MYAGIINGQSINVLQKKELHVAIKSVFSILESQCRSWEWKTLSRLILVKEKNNNIQQQNIAHLKAYKLWKWTVASIPDIVNT